MNLTVDFLGGLVRADRPRHLLDLELKTAPAGPIVPLEDLKAHMTVTFDDDDDLIGALGLAIEQGFDGYSGTLGRALLAQTWRLHLDNGFPCGGGAIRLPMPPLISVVAVSYVDADGATQILDPSLYVALTGGRAELVPAPGVAWPPTRRQARAVTIEFSCGYATAADVPGPIKSAIKMYAAGLYENREATVIGPSVQVVENPAAEILLRPYRLVGV